LIALAICFCCIIFLAIAFLFWRRRSVAYGLGNSDSTPPYSERSASEQEMQEKRSSKRGSWMRGSKETEEAPDPFNPQDPFQQDDDFKKKSKSSNASNKSVEDYYNSPQEVLKNGEKLF